MLYHRSSYMQWRERVHSNTITIAEQTNETENLHKRIMFYFFEHKHTHSRSRSHNLQITKHKVNEDDGEEKKKMEKNCVFGQWPRPSVRSQQENLVSKILFQY